MSDEELEKLISYRLVSGKRKRTLIGRMVRKALRGIIEEFRLKDSGLGN